MAAEEDPFELIKKGNASEAASDHWRSSEYYGRASVCLRRRADDLSSQIRTGGADAAKWKIVSLFRAQSLEYLYKARHFLIEALRFENDQDRSRTLEVAKTGTGSLDPLYSMITLEESEKRKLTFERLFSRGGEVLECESDVTDDGNQADAPVESTGESEQIKENGTSEGNTSCLSHSAAATSDTNSSNIEPNENTAESSPPTHDEIVESIAVRLADLDSSLLPKVPPPFISGSRSSGGSDNQNRLEEIKRGLGRLGVSLPDSKGGKSDLIPENISAEDQVKLIIQQAKDEVRVERGHHVGEHAESNKLESTIELDDDIVNENDSMFEGFEEEEYDIDTLLAKAENLATKTGIKSDGEGKISSELVQIRKVQALLLEARLCLEIEQAKSSVEQKVSSTDSKETECEAKGKEDMSDAVSENSEENDHSAKASKLAARNEARKRIENAQVCMKQILNDWK